MDQDIEKIYYSQEEVRDMLGIRNHWALKRIVETFNIPSKRIRHNYSKFHKDSIKLIRQGIKKLKRVEEIKKEAREKIAEYKKYKKEVDLMYSNKIKELVDAKRELIADVHLDIEKVELDKVKAIRKTLGAVQEGITNPPV